MTRALRHAFALALAVALAAPSARAAGGGMTAEQVRSSVVQVFVQANPVDVFSPWQGTGTGPSYGSGVIIEGNRILTAAHVVADHVTIEVKRQGGTRRHEAEVLFLAHDCDLALLGVDDASFFEGGRPVPLGPTPRIEDAVRVYGYPEGGDTVSVTSGIVSRVELSSYVHSWRTLLLAQVDAAINAGNSGGPVISGGKLAGIAVQMLADAENVGYIVPSAVIRHLLDDVKDGRYDGFPQLGATLQPLENDSLRSEYGAGADDRSGALVSQVGYGSPARGALEAGDVILAVDGLAVAEDMTVAAPEIGRVGLEHLISMKQAGEETAFTLMRKGRRIERKAKAGVERPLVPSGLGAPGRSYYIFGGLVFQPLTMNYLAYTRDEENCSTTDLDYWAYFHNRRTAERDQVVMLSKVLPAPLNKGFHDYVDLIVETVQGVRPRDLAHLARLVGESKEKRLRVVAETGEIVVLDMKRAREANREILEAHGVDRDRSADLGP